MVDIRKEKLQLTNVSIAGMIDSKLHGSIEKEFGNTLIPITIVFVNRQNGVPLLVAHENQKEVDSNVVHVLCQDEAVLERFIKLLGGG